MKVTCLCVIHRVEVQLLSVLMELNSSKYIWIDSIKYSKMKNTVIHNSMKAGLRIIMNRSGLWISIQPIRIRHWWAFFESRCVTVRHCTLQPCNRHSNWAILILSQCTLFLQIHQNNLELFLPVSFNANGLSPKNYRSLTRHCQPRTFSHPRLVDSWIVCNQLLIKLPIVTNTEGLSLRLLKEL